MADTVSLANMARQWPENVIMPATARHRMEMWHYNDIKRALYNGLSLEDAIKVVLHEIKQKVGNEYFDRNGWVFKQTLKEDFSEGGYGLVYF